MPQDLEHLIICRPVRSMYAPLIDSRKRPCHFCGTKVWASRATRAQAEQPGFGIVCFECAEQRNPGLPVSLTEATRRELAAVDPAIAEWADGLVGMPAVETPLHPSWRGRQA